MRGGSGFVQLDILDPAQVGPQNLELRAESGRYILLLGELTEDDHYVRTPQLGIPASELVKQHGFTARNEFVELHGDFWPYDAVCLDYNIVLQAFREFFENGDVSRELLK